MGKRGNLNVQHVKRYSISSVKKKKKRTTNYKEIIHSCQSGHFGDNLASSSKAGDAYTLPTYTQPFSLGFHKKVSPTENDSSDYFLNPLKDDIKLKTGGVLVND